MSFLCKLAGVSAKERIQTSVLKEIKIVQILLHTENPLEMFWTSKNGTPFLARHYGFVQIGEYPKADFGTCR